MTETEVHLCGTKVIIDREKRTIGTQYPGDDDPREIYSLDEQWVEKFTICRVCGKELDDIRLAFAYWKLEQSVCSSECLSAETHKRYACCEKAKRTNCVCQYSTTCPDHGERHFGTHD
jgi:hypothetical protein